MTMTFPGLPNAILCPSCDACSAATRLVGIEPHPTNMRVVLYTYACLRCDGVQTRCFPSED